MATPDRKIRTTPTEKLHGRVIKYSQISSLPGRRKYLNPAEVIDVDSKIEAGEKLLFKPNGVYEYHWQDIKFAKAKYKILLTGVLTDGRRANVVLCDIDPYFEVILKGKSSIDEEVNHILSELEGQNLAPTDKKLFKAKPFLGYQKEQSTFLRLYFFKTKIRSAAIKHIRLKNYKTTHDDLSCYYRVVCRDRLISYTAWMTIDDYNIREIEALKSPAFFVNVKNYEKVTDEKQLNAPLLKYDKTMTKAWDIETYNSSDDGHVPQPDRETDMVFMISFTFQWYYANDTNVLLKVAIVDKPCDPHPDFLTIICKTEENVIKAIGKLHERMQPEYTIGFNDHDYDWPWVVERGYKYPGVLKYLADHLSCDNPWKPYEDESVMSYNYKKELVKTEADTYVAGHSLNMPGCINIDVRTLFRQLYATAEESNLNFYLKKNKLLGKKDMPYLRMFRIYRDCLALWNSQNIERTPPELEGVKTKEHFLKWLATNPEWKAEILDVLLPADIEAKSGDIVDEEKIVRSKFTPVAEKRILLKSEMAEVAEYCVIDSFRCHQLLKIRSVIMERREIADVSFTSAYDAFYRANGSKVRNLVIAQVQLRGYRVSNVTDMRDIEDGKYPGAFVIPPKKGLVKSKLSMDERIEKANTIQEFNVMQTKLNDKKSEAQAAPLKANIYKKWLKVAKTDVVRWKKLVAKHGAIISREIIETIEKKENIELPTCFKEFLEESIGRPITGLDFSSLYPSLIMTYNLSPEYIVTDKALAKELDKEGVKLNKIKFQYNGRTIRAWSIAHNGVTDPTNNSSNNPFGVYPSILKGLYDTRKKIRKPMNLLSDDDKKAAATRKTEVGSTDVWQVLKWEARKKVFRWENFGWEEKQEFMDDETDLFDTVPEFMEEYEEVCFWVNSINSKQKALKVFMNTFYGETGNKKSPFFILPIAGGITTAGQRNLKAAVKIVEGEGWGVTYGDTDSVYIYPPDSVFKGIDKAFYSGEIDKITYYTKMVELTFEHIKPLRDKVNNWFFEDNGTRFLKMAYEESLYPAAFLAKKKYFGIPHVSIANFSPKHLFIRGLETKKRGASEFLKKICNAILWDCVNMNNVNSIIELVQNKVVEIYNSAWEFDDFVQTGVYRPPKKDKPGNITMNTFVERMRLEGRNVKPGERFKYVIVKKYPFKYDGRGRKKALSVGERMEFADVAREKGLAVDIDHYMSGSVNGQLGRFIVYHYNFYVEADSDDIEDIKTAEKKTYQNACKYIEGLCSKYYTCYASKGKIYQKVFRSANKLIKTELQAKYENKQIVDLLACSWDTDKLEQWMSDKAEKEAVKYMKKSDYGVSYVEKKIIHRPSNTSKNQVIEELCKAYLGPGKILDIREGLYAKRKNQQARNLSDNVKNLENVYSMYNMLTSKISDIIKDIIDVDSRFEEPSDRKNIEYDDIAETKNIDLDILEDEARDQVDIVSKDKRFWMLMNTLKDIYEHLVNNEIYIMKVRRTADHLKFLKAKKNRMYSLGKIDQVKLAKKLTDETME